MKPLLTAILILSCNAVYCQLSFGVEAGLNVNAFSRDSYNTTGMAYAPFFAANRFVGFHLGGLAQIPLAKKLQLQPQLRFVQRGTDHGENSDRVRLLYLQFPVSLLYRPGKRFSLEGGPVFSRKLDSKIGDFDQDGYSTFETYTYAAELGINFHLTNSIALGASYYHGLKPALRMKFYDVDNTILAYDKYYNRSAQVTLQYSLATINNMQDK